MSNDPAFHLVLTALAHKEMLWLFVHRRFGMRRGSPIRSGGLRVRKIGLKRHNYFINLTGFFSPLRAGILLPFSGFSREWGLLNFAIVLMLKYQAQLCPRMPLFAVRHGANRTHASSLERIPFSNTKDVWIITPPLLIKQEDTDAKSEHFGPQFFSAVKEIHELQICAYSIPHYVRTDERYL